MEYQKKKREGNPNFCLPTLKGTFKQELLLISKHASKLYVKSDLLVQTHGSSEEQTVLYYTGI